MHIKSKSPLRNILKIPSCQQWDVRLSSSCLYLQAACVSVSIAVCAVAPVRLSQSADYTHDKPNFLLALHSGSFQALRIPSAGFLSSFIPSFALPFLPSAKKNKKQNADFRLVLRDDSSSPSALPPFLLKPESFITSYIKPPLSVTKATKPPSRCDLNGLTFPQLVFSCTRLSGRLKPESFSTGFICKANIDLWPVFLMHPWPQML